MGRIQKLLKNPDTRATLDAKFLSPKQRQQRQLNQRLDTPVVNGSQLTGRGLAHQRQAEQQLQYGPQEQALGRELGQAQQLGRDQQGWFQQYQNDLRQHAEKVRANNQAATQALTQLTGNIGQQGQPQGMDPSVAADAQKGSAVRQALIGSFGAQLNQTGAASNQYADTLANVVAPGQRLTAANQNARTQSGIQEKQTALAGDKAAFGRKYDADTIANELKNVVAQQALGLDVQKQSASEAAGRSTRRETRRSNQAKEQNTATTGYKPGGSSMNKYGFTYDEWDALSPGARDKARAGKGSKPKAPGDAFLGRYGVKPASQEKVSSVQNEIGKAKSWVATVKTSNPAMTDQELVSLLTRGQAKTKDSPAIPALGDLWVQVAIDLAGPLHRVTNATANRLHHAGYSVKTLGLPSVGGTKAPKLLQSTSQMLSDLVP